MSTQVQLRRDTATNIGTFTGKNGECVVDTTNNRLVVQDGATAGGFPAAKLSEVVSAKRTAISDTIYTVLVSDRIVAYTSLTAARNVTLPAASAFPVGVPLWIIDESGACSGTLYIAINRAGSDTIDGANSTTLNGAYQGTALESNGVNGWTIIGRNPNESLTALGIGTPSDSTNPLSVKAGQALFNAISNSFTIYVNKTASGNNAAVLFEDAFASKAQLGLIGDDNFHFQVYNGTSWIDALNINNSTGLATLSTGKLSLVFGTNNSAVGLNALSANTTGFNNSAVGVNALAANTTGGNNSAVGDYTLNANTTGSNNSAVGFGALYDLGQAQTAGSFIVGISYTIKFIGTTDFTLIGAASNTVGVVFTATGAGSGTGTATPNTNNNVAFGNISGRGIIYGSSNTIIGSQVTGLAAGLSGAVIIATGDGTSRADYNFTKTGAWTFSAPIRKPVYTVATLPSASGVGAGACAAVTDATAPVFGSAPVGSGAVFTPVISNGTTWQVG